MNSRTLLLVASSLVIALALVSGPASATQGQPVIAGQSNDATSVTTIDNTTPGLGQQGLWVTASGNAIYGSGDVGVAGDGASWGVRGGGPIGVWGNGVGLNNVGVRGFGNGESQSNLQGTGVLGTGTHHLTGVEGIGGNQGVWGQYGGEPGSIGVRASGGYSGIAFKAEGTAKFSRAGKLVIPEGATKANKYLTASANVSDQLTGQSLVLATLQQNRPGVFIQAAVPHSDPDGGWITVFLNKPAPAPTTVAWFIVN